MVDFAVTGKTVALTRVHYGFSDRAVLAGLADPAAPGLTAPRERGTVADRIVVRDAAGTVVEDLPYQQQ